MQDKVEILKKIDAAIDAMDEASIDSGLQALYPLEPQPIQMEDPSLFAARIQKRNKENHTMKQSAKGFRIAIVAAVILIMSVTVYATGALRFFRFQQGDKFVTLRTNQDITQSEAEQLVSVDFSTSSIPEEAVGQVQTQEFTFDSVEEAEQTLDMEIVIPGAMPEIPLESAMGSTALFGEDMQSHTVWLNYQDDAGRMMGITVVREVVKPGSDVISYTTGDIDEGSLGKYKSKSGIVYQTLTESDDTGSKTAHIATTIVGEYEYNLVFFGFEQSEREAIIDSADLSIYK